jgi:hypothetical protein
MTTDNFTSMEAADPPRSPSGPAGAQATAAGGDRPFRWEALLMSEGLNGNRLFKPAAAVRQAAPLFVGVSVRAARSLSFPHGSADQPAGASGPNSQYVLARLTQMLGRARLRVILDADAELTAAADADPRLLTPMLIGRIRRARYEPCVGVIGEIEFNDATIDGPLTWTGLVRRRERIGPALERAWRDGYSDLLRLSMVGMIVDAESPLGPIPPRARSSVEVVTAITAVDVVFFAASDAYLIRPLD